MRFTTCLLLAVLFSALSLPSAWCADPPKPNPWEGAIAAYENADAITSPPKNAIVIIGSSNIVLWTTTTLERQFPEYNIINRGFGGSQVADAVEFAHRIVIPYAPRAVYLRSGGNDLWAGKSPDQVCEDVKKFISVVHDKLPKTDIVFVSVSPCISRQKQAELTKEMNQKIAAFIKGKPHLRYVETYDIVLDSAGNIRPELFVKDQLHFNDLGYEALAARVRPDLEKHYKPDRKVSKR